MKTPEKSQLLKEYFLNASLIALALELAKEKTSLNFAESEIETVDTEENPLPVAA
ncbi:MAG: hypothetical protein ACI8UO_003059 [Verrucomicrobiales bacterium]|jgi:hypothetical protein